MSTDTYCDLVPSNREHPKLVVNGYLMTKDKNRDDLFYWCCEKRKRLKCNGYASTILVDGKHKLRTSKEHNHAPEPAKKDVETARASIKRKAHESRDTPAQIVQDESNNVPGSSQASLPSRRALREVIKRVRKEDMPPQLVTLSERTTLSER